MFFKLPAVYPLY